MFSNMSNKARLLLIASLVLNIAFITGFFLKKYAFHPKPITHPMPIQSIQNSCQMNNPGFGYTHLCQRNPGFQSTFHDFQVYYQAAFQDLKEVKIAFLTQLKLEKPDYQLLEKLIGEMNQRSNELNERNYRHLMTLKSLLTPVDFKMLMDSMSQALGSCRDVSLPMGKGACMDSGKGCEK